MPDADSRSSRASRAEVAGTLRRKILSGFYGPGCQIPTREVLASRLGASYVTIQRGLDLLREEGFIHSQRGSGTFVVDHPPHLHHYGLVMPLAPGATAPGWGRFRQRLCDEAALVERDLPPKRVRIWYNVEFHEDCESYQSLLRMVQCNCLAGLMFPNNPTHLDGSPLLRQPGVGLAMVGHPKPDMPCLCGLAPDHEDYLRRAFAELARQGRQRVAVLLPPGVFQDVTEDIVADRVGRLAAAAGLRTRLPWILPVHPTNAAGIRRIVNLLLEDRATERPDGLVLVDDHMVEPATLGARDAGIADAAALGIIGYANFPDRPLSHLPIRYLGIDVRHLLRTMLALIDEQRANRHPPRFTPLPAIFAEELPYPLGEPFTGARTP